MPKKVNQKDPAKSPNPLLLNNDRKPKFIKENDVVRKQINQLIEKIFVKTCEPPNAKVSVDLENHKIIYNLLQEVIALEKSVERVTVDRLAKSTQERFVAWLTKAGANIKNVGIAAFDNYELGLKAETDLNKDVIVCSIPRALMLSHDKIKTSGKFCKFVQKDPMLSEMNNVALAMFLLYEKVKQNSYWKPYIDMLPTSYSTVHYFTILEMEQLLGTRALKPALSQFKSIARQYCYFFGRLWATDEAVAEAIRESFTFEEYRWAVSTVMTRENMIPSSTDPNEGVLALIPFWDLANHSKGYISTSYDIKEDKSVCVAMRDFKKDEQVFIHYHNRSNLDFFLHNGFVFEDSETDVYPLSLGMSTSDKLLKKRDELLKKLGLSTSETFYLQDSLDPFDCKLLEFCRVFVMDQECLDSFLSGEKALKELTEPDGTKPQIQVEIKAWKFLEMRLKLLIAVFKTKLEEDVASLKDDSLPENTKSVVRMRICDRKLLTKFCALISAKLKLLEAL